MVAVSSERPTGAAREDRAERGPLSALQGLLILSTLLLRQDDPRRILHTVATAAPAMAPCRTEGVIFNGHWSDLRASEGESEVSLDTLTGNLETPSEGGVLSLSGAMWGFAYPLLSSVEALGFLVVSAEVIPTQHEQFLLRALAQQGGAAVANAILHARERDHAAQLGQAILSLERERGHPAAPHPGRTGAGGTGRDRPGGP